MFGRSANSPVYNGSFGRPEQRDDGIIWTKLRGIAGN